MEGLSYKSVPQMLKDKAEKHPDKVALAYKKEGKYIPISYKQFYENALMCARGLSKMGINKGDFVAILSENRVGWVISDMGILSLGCVTVPIYPTNTPEQIKYVLNHSESKAVFISTKSQYEKLLEIKDDIPSVKFVVSYEKFLGDKSLPLYTFNQLLEVSHPLTESEKKTLEEGIEQIIPEDMLTCIYTSGTTGVPKGVILTHKNILWDAYLGIKKVEVLDDNEVLLSFLPLSHSLERTIGYYLPVMKGSAIYFAESVEKVPENMMEVKPTIVISVPRLFEKIYSKIFEAVHNMPPIKKRLFHAALNTAQEYIEKKYERKEPLGFTAIKYKFFDALVYKKLREKVGGRIKFFVSGGAPLDKNINKFFWSLGIRILEGYGLTETSPAVCINNFRLIKFGSVGTAFEHTYFKTDVDGELLIKGPMVMKGYYKNDEATREVLDEEGWFRTGDIAKIDEEGFIFIVDRKKELIVTAGGKNIAPQPIENMLKLDKYVSQAIVYGDRKPYLVALITPNIERLIEFAKENNIDYLDLEQLVLNKKVIKLYEERIKDINSKLPKYETIKRIAILPRDFSIETGEVTPTLKLKRKVIYEKFKEKIEKLYEGTSD